MTKTSKRSPRNHTYTNAERKKAYGMKKTPLTISGESLPKGKNSESEKKRQEILSKIYSKRVADEKARIVYCPSLGSNVLFTNKTSTRETKHRSSGDWKSTALAIDIERLFDVAEILYVESAKNNKSQSSFSSMVVLIAAVKGYGYAKIIVGKYRDANAEVPYCQYCVMSVSLRKLKNK